MVSWNKVLYFGQKNNIYDLFLKCWTKIHYKIEIEYDKIFKLVI